VLTEKRKRVKIDDEMADQSAIKWPSINMTIEENVILDPDENNLTMASEIKDEVTFSEVPVMNLEIKSEDELSCLSASHGTSENKILDDDESPSDAWNNEDKDYLNRTAIMIRDTQSQSQWGVVSGGPINVGPVEGEFLSEISSIKLHVCPKCPKVFARLLDLVLHKDEHKDFTYYPHLKPIDEQVCFTLPMNFQENNQIILLHFLPIIYKNDELHTSLTIQDLCKYHIKGLNTSFKLWR